MEEISQQPVQQQPVQQQPLQPTREPSNKGAWISAIVVLAAVGAYFLYAKTPAQAPDITDANKTEFNEQESKQPPVDADPLSEAVVIKDFKNTVADGKPTAYASQRFTANGKFEEAYLVVSALVDGKPLTQYDSLYMKLGAVVDGTYKEIGGHLRRDKSIEKQPLDRTLVVYNARNVAYKEKSPYSEEGEPLSADWLSLLNNGVSHRVTGFVSTLQQGEIQEVKIRYRCVKDSACKIGE
ncbi:MAG: hypothetical protein V1707_00900 [bacterium]